MKAGIFRVALLLLCTAASSHSEEKSSPPGKTAGQICAVYEISDNETMWPLAEVSRGEFLGVPCITGRFVDTGPIEGRMCHIPVDKVAVVIEFDSMEQFKAFLEDEGEPSHAPDRAEHRPADRGAVFGKAES